MIERTRGENEHIFHALQKIADAELIASGTHKDVQCAAYEAKFVAIVLLDEALEQLSLLRGVEIPIARAFELYGDIVPEVSGSHRLLKPAEYYQRAVDILKTAPDFAAVAEPIIRVTQKLNRKPGVST